MERAEAAQNWKLPDRTISAILAELAAYAPDEIAQQRRARYPLGKTRQIEHVAHGRTLVEPKLWHQNRGAVELARAEIGKRLVGLPERVCCGFGDNADLWSQSDKIDRILPCEIGNRY